MGISALRPCAVATRPVTRAPSVVRQVDAWDGRLARVYKPAPWVEQRLGEAVTWVSRSATGAAFARVQLTGLADWVDGAGRLPPGPTVVVPTHINAWDGFVLGAVHSQLPPIADADAATTAHTAMMRFVMRQPVDVIEKLCDAAVGGAFTVHITTPDQTFYSPRQTKRALDGAVKNNVGAGDWLVIFPEGRMRGDGSVRVTAHGAVRTMRQLDGHPVRFMPMGLAYEFLGRPKPAVLVHVGRAFCIDAEVPDYRHFLAAQLQEALVCCTPLTLSGIVGASLLLARQAAKNLRLSAADLTTLVGNAVQRRQAANLLHIAIDADLVDAARRLEVCGLAHAQLQERGYVQSDGQVNWQRLGPAADFNAASLPWDALSSQTHSDDPLRYWGNRTLQRMHYQPELSDVIFIA